MKATKSEEALEKLLKNEGVDVEQFKKEKERLMIRKNISGRRSVLAAHVVAPPAFLETGRESKK
jgi:hypothetical protein